MLLGLQRNAIANTKETFLRAKQLLYMDHFMMWFKPKEAETILKTKTPFSKISKCFLFTKDCIYCFSYFGQASKSPDLESMPTKIPTYSFQTTIISFQMHPMMSLISHLS